MMDDDLRTLLQNFLEDFCAVDMEDSEERAEMLGGLLFHKGYNITRFGSEIDLVKKW